MAKASWRDFASDNFASLGVEDGLGTGGVEAGVVAFSFSPFFPPRRPLRADLRSCHASCSVGL